MQNKTIRIGIELNHVIRNINKQLAKYYQKEYNADIDLDELDYSRDIWHEVCKFKSDQERVEFMYENYPYEIFGMANEMDQMISRDLNIWIKQLENYEEYNIEIFFYSLKEVDITISSTYYFLSKIGSRVRKIIFPKSIDELMEYGDLFITANPDVMAYNTQKDLFLIKNKFNEKYITRASRSYDSFKDFIKNPKKLEDIVGLLCSNCEAESTSTFTKLTNWFKSLWHRDRN